MKRALLGSLLAVSLASLPRAQAAPTPATSDLSGVYACDGVQEGGVAYSGVVHIVKRNDAYHVLWTLADQTRYVGVGVVAGNVLAVSYFAGRPGVVVYDINGGESGRLTGRWTIIDPTGQVFSETLRKLKPAEIEALPQEAPVTPRPRGAREGGTAV